ncbi:hypothetical protein [Lutibacter sp.]|jgi:hypothetical protein|uniref:HYC_CC_PP family protein n=1 Tax=Lutibacter sp. TaxID=1925666 RepID=UPI003568D174
MIDSVRKITAIIMAFVVLFSTMSFSFSEHYCGDHLVDSALFSKAESCGMEMETATADSDCNSFKKDCCSDKIKQIEGQSNLKIDFNSLSIPQQEFLVAFTNSYLNIFQGVDKRINTFEDYSPPLVDKDLNVLYRVFRI